MYNKALVIIDKYTPLLFLNEIKGFLNKLDVKCFFYQTSNFSFSTLLFCAESRVISKNMTHNKIKYVNEDFIKKNSFLYLSDFSQNRKNLHEFIDFKYYLLINGNSFHKCSFKSFYIPIQDKNESSYFRIKVFLKNKKKPKINLNFEIQTASIGAKNFVRSFKLSNLFLKKGINQIKTDTKPEIIKEKFLLSKYFINALKNILIKKLKKGHKKFSVYLYNKKDNKLMQLMNQENKWNADPFLVEFKGEHYIFFEEYDTNKMKGHLACSKIESNKIIYLGEILDSKEHLSFPFIFEHEKKFYMVPESSSKRSVDIYKCTDFPFKWEHSHSILKDISAVDSVIFYHKNLFWLFTNSNYDILSQPHNSLSIFYSDNLFETNWIPHAQNPILIKNGGRNAGRIIIEGKTIYRVSQKYGYQNYGNGVLFNEIIKLTTSEYKEKISKQFTPYNKINGIPHHFDKKNNFEVFDLDYV